MDCKGQLCTAISLSLSLSSFYSPCFYAGNSMKNGVNWREFSSLKRKEGWRERERGMFCARVHPPSNHLSLYLSIHPSFHSHSHSPSHSPFAADIISAVEFDETGDYLATGDKGGRVVLFERNEAVTMGDHWRTHIFNISHPSVYPYILPVFIPSSLEKGMRVQVLHGIPVS